MDKPRQWRKARRQPSGSLCNLPLSSILTVQSRLHEPAFKVTFDVENTGSVPGTEVCCLFFFDLCHFTDCPQIPQLYIHHPTDAGEPPSILKGFNNVEVDPGQTEQVTITLSRYDLSIWDVVAQGWRKPTGTINFSVGASSRDLRLRGVIPE